MKLKKEYGMTSGWAIWDEGDITSSAIVDNNIEILHSKVVVLGLAASKKITQDWGNFRLGIHDRKLRMIFNNDPRFKGSYMTVLFKESERLNKKIQTPKNLKLREEDKSFLEIELDRVGANESTLFILLGDKVDKDINLFLPKKYLNNRAIKFRSHSDFSLKDYAWVAENLLRLK